MNWQPGINMFDYRYLLSIRNRIEDNVRMPAGRIVRTKAGNPRPQSDFYDGTQYPNDDDMSQLQEIAPDDYMNYRRPTRDEEYPDREVEYYDDSTSRWIEEQYREQQELDQRLQDDYYYQAYYDERYYDSYNYGDVYA